MTVYNINYKYARQSCLYKVQVVEGKDMATPTYTECIWNHSKQLNTYRVRNVVSNIGRRGAPCKLSCMQGRESGWNSWGTQGRIQKAWLGAMKRSTGEGVWEEVRPLCRKKWNFSLEVAYFGEFCAHFLKIWGQFSLAFPAANSGAYSPP